MNALVKANIFLIIVQENSITYQKFYFWNSTQPYTFSLVKNKKFSPLCSRRFLKNSICLPVSKLIFWHAHCFFRIFLKNCLSSFYKKIQKIKFWKYFAQNFSLVYDFVMYTNLTPWKVIQVLQLLWLHKRLCATNILFNKVVPSKKVKSSLHVDGESKRGKNFLIKAKLAKM